MTTMTGDARAVRVPEWTFGDRIRKVRRETGLSQAEFARRLAIGHPAYASWELSKSAPRSPHHIARLVEDQFGISGQWLLGLDPSPFGGGGGATTMPKLPWGRELAELVALIPGGQRRAVEVIGSVVGQHIGSRSTFARLYGVMSADDLEERDRFRAWLLITAAGDDPDRLGVGDEAVPPSIDLPRLRRVLRSECAIRDSNPEPAD